MSLEMDDKYVDLLMGWCVYWLMGLGDKGLKRPKRLKRLKYPMSTNLASSQENWIATAFKQWQRMGKRILLTRGAKPLCYKCALSGLTDHIDFLKPWKGVLVERGFSPLRMGRRAEKYSKWHQKCTKKLYKSI